MGHDLGIRITADREIQDPRVNQALKNPIRRKYALKDVDALDCRIESPLGRMLLDKKITEQEYEAGDRWRKIYDNWLKCISDSPDLSDEAAEAFERSYKLGAGLLLKLGRRVFDSVNAICVYEEPEELGDFKYTAEAARIGLHALADLFDYQEDYKSRIAQWTEEENKLEVPMVSRLVSKKSGPSRGARELMAELRSSGVQSVLLDCDEDIATGKVEIKRYSTWNGRF